VYLFIKTLEISRVFRKNFEESNFSEDVSQCDRRTDVARLLSRLCFVHKREKAWTKLRNILIQVFTENAVRKTRYKLQEERMHRPTKKKSQIEGRTSNTRSSLSPWATEGWSLTLLVLWYGGGASGSKGSLCDRPTRKALSAALNRKRKLTLCEIDCFSDSFTTLFWCRIVTIQEFGGRKRSWRKTREV
jgi:hypothetical protein